MGYVKHTNDAALKCMLGAHLLPWRTFHNFSLLQLEEQIRWREDSLCCLTAVVLKQSGLLTSCI